MGVDRHAAAIVADGQDIARRKFHLDAAGMAGHRLVHRIVEDFGGQMMQRVDVGAADIHAGAAAHGLQPFQNLDVLGGIGFGRWNLWTANRSWVSLGMAESSNL